MHGLFVRANLPIFPIVRFESWLDGVFFVFGIVRSVVVSCAGIAVFSTAWFRPAPLTSAVCLYLGRLILDWILFIVVVVLFGCIHYVYVIRGGGFLAPCKRWFLCLLLSGIFIHTVDVFGAIIEHVG